LGELNSTTMWPDMAFGENLHALISHYSSLLLLAITYVGGAATVRGCDCRAGRENVDLEMLLIRLKMVVPARNTRLPVHDVSSAAHLVIGHIDISDTNTSNVYIPGKQSEILEYVF
jgi:hypothetical protein